MCRLTCVDNRPRVFVGSIGVCAHWWLCTWSLLWNERNWDVQPVPGNEQQQWDVLLLLYYYGGTLFSEPYFVVLFTNKTTPPRPPPQQNEIVLFFVFFSCVFFIKRSDFFFFFQHRNKKKRFLRPKTIMLRNCAAILSAYVSHAENCTCLEWTLRWYVFIYHVHPDDSSLLIRSPVHPHIHWFCSNYYYARW